MPGGFDLGVGRAVAFSPRLCTGRRVFGNLNSDNGRHAISDARPLAEAADVLKQIASEYGERMP